MSAQATATVDEVAEFYDDTAWTVELVGGSIHVGYWLGEDDRTPLLEAINRFTDIVGDKLDLRSGEHLLDVGCGAGMPAIRLGQRTDATITGISNSEWHLAEARRRVNAAGLRGQVRIEYGDAAALTYGDTCFDAVLALESLVHAQDREQWLREMCRVLRPGGRVVLTDLAEEVPLSASEEEMFRESALALPIPGLDVVELVRRSGFVVDEYVSCGDRIKRSYPAYFDRVAQRRTDLVAAYGADKVDAFLLGMPPLLDVLRAKVGYVIVAGHKP